MNGRQGGGRTRNRWLGVLGLICGVAGCGTPPPPAPSLADQIKGSKLVVGVVGDPALLQSVSAQRGEWLANTHSELGLREVPAEPRAIDKDVDVLVFAGDRLGDLVEAGTLAVLPQSLVNPPPAPEPDPGNPTEPPRVAHDPLQFANVATGYRDLVSKYGPNRYGLPIGGSALVIAFHRAAFTNPAFLAAARDAGLALEPPQTWEQFDALARFFHGRDLDGDGQPDYGVVLPWGPDPAGVGDAVFLARTAAAALHPDQYSFLLDSETTEPRVASPPFVESLRALVALRSCGPPRNEGFDATAARAAFRSGRVALLVDRAEAAATWGTGQIAIGVAPLPGSRRVFDPSRAAWETPSVPNRAAYLPSGGGWLVGVAAGSSHKVVAEAFVRYLAGPEATNRLRAERDFPMLAVRTDQLAQGMSNPRSAPGVEARSWAEAVAQTINAEKVFPGLRVPGATAYLADVSHARFAASNGQAAEDVLKTLADAWTKRTQTLGLARQTWHHRQSLVGPSTAAEPPPR